MSFYFRSDGTVNLGRLTLTSGFFLSIYTWTFLLGVAPVRDGCIPLLKEGSALSRDQVLFSKLKPSPRHIKELQNRVVAIKNPFKPDELLFRRVVATENFWIKRADDSGLIQIPKGHLWVECDDSCGGIDSLYKLGPISTGLLVGEVKAVVWPPQRVAWFQTMESFKRLNNYLTKQKTNRPKSQVFTSDEIYDTYHLARGSKE